MAKFVFPFFLLAMACSPVSTQQVTQGLPDSYKCTLPDGTQVIQKFGTSDSQVACVQISGVEAMEDTSSSPRSAVPATEKAPIGTMNLPQLP